MAGGIPQARRIKAGISLLGATALLSLCATIGWKATYPEGSDPKNIHYVLWKHGLSNNINLDDAVAGMTHDSRAENIVKGMSKAEINRRFGYIRTLDQVTPYLRECYTGVASNGKEVVFLRDSWWMVILDHGKAIDLVLCKGY